MPQTTVDKFATELKMPAGILLEQLAAAGVAGKKQGDKLSEQDKTRLLDYLRKQHGGQDQKKKITLTRKQTTEIKAADSTGRARTIQVEVRKRRVFVKRDGAEAAAAAEEAVPAVPQPVVTAAELAAREEEARKGAALIAKQQEEIQQKQEQAKKRKTKKEKEEEEALAKAAEAESAAVSAKPAPAAAMQPAASAKAEAKAKTEGTLHKPVAKPGAKKDKPSRKPSATAFQEEAARRRALKLRGDITGGAAAAGWKQPKGGKHRHEDGEEHDEGAHAVAGPEPMIRQIAVPETITVADLARKMSVKAAEIIKAMMKLGTMVTINQMLDQETAMIVVEEMGHKAIAAK
ncbi:MAG: translation initiation factor IF-2 N-terminal domain-containing protein, partial [Casimicrobiaceae bacterium]